MELKLLTFLSNKQLKVGIKTEKGILDLSKALEKNPHETIPSSMDEIIASGEEVLAQLKVYIEKVQNEEDLFYQEDELTFGPAVPNPEKIICVGLNYKKHAIESNMLPFPEQPILFSKYANSLSAHKEPVQLPKNAKQIDYEAELAIIIGKTAKNVREEEALDYVAGYSNGNDLSARDLQFVSSQWLLGKTTDGFCPVGPYVVTADEVEDPDNLEIRLTMNGRERQNSTTADMIFNCREIISYISKHMTLKPGDIILTGTPEGVIMGDPEGERDWIKSGDEVTVEIEKLGKLTTTFK